MSWTEITIHHSASPDHDDSQLSDIRTWHKARGFRREGYHWIVDMIDGEYHFYMGRPMFMVGAHNKGRNRRALGVCFIGNYMVEFPPLKQIITGAEGVAGLCVTLGISPRNIKRHSETRDTDCPGALFPFDELLRVVDGFVEGAEVTTNG